MRWAVLSLGRPRCSPMLSYRMTMVVGWLTTPPRSFDEAVGRGRAVLRSP